MSSTATSTPTSSPSASSLPAALPAVTVGQLVAQTVAQNPEIRFYENEIRFARERRDVAGRWQDPELSVGIGRKTARDLGGPTHDGLAWSVTLSQKFDFSGRAAIRKAIAEHQIVAAEAGLAQFRRELAAKTAELARSLLAAQRRLEASEIVAARGRALLATLVQRDPAGVAAALEAKIIEADILKLAKNAVAQRAALLTALAELNLLRGASPDAPLTLANVATDFAPAPANDALLSAAVRGNFTLRQFEADLAGQGAAVTLEEKNAWGDVTISPFFSEERAGSRERSAGLGVSIPLPLWNANKEATAEARSRRTQAETALFKARRDLRRDVVSAALAYRAALETLLPASLEKVAEFRHAAELGERHYRLGTIPVTTYLALQQASLESLDNHLSACIEAVQAASKLTALTGLPLETFVREIPPKKKPSSVTAEPRDKPADKKTAADHADHAGHAAHDDHDDHDHAGHDHGKPSATARPDGKPSAAAGTARPTVAHPRDEHSHGTADGHGHDHAHDHDHGAGASAAEASFSPETGLRISDATRAALGIRTAKAEECLIAHEILLAARSYAADGGRRALAVVTAEQAAVLEKTGRALLESPLGVAPPKTTTPADTSANGNAPSAKPTTAAAKTDVAKTAAAAPVFAPLLSLSAVANAAGQREAVFALPHDALADTALVLRVIVPASTPVLAVPRAAVLDAASGTFVYLVRNGAYRRVSVKTGTADAAHIEIVSGLRLADEIVVAPVSQLWLTELRLTKGGGHSH
jgi:cobalt-zinc-cadmium efflux system outer membrane protein